MKKLIHLIVLTALLFISFFSFLYGVRFFEFGLYGALQVGIILIAISLLCLFVSYWVYR